MSFTKTRLSILFVSFVIFSFAIPLISYAGVFDYRPLAGGVDIGGASLEDYFNNLFSLALLVGSILAVLVIATGGLEYMTTDAVSGKESGKTRIRQAILGLLMLLGIWIFFNEVNPNILNINFDLENVETTVSEIEEAEVIEAVVDPSTFSETEPGLVSESCGGEHEVGCDTVREYCDRAGYVEVSIDGRDSVECKSTEYCVNHVGEADSCVDYFGKVEEEGEYVTYENQCGYTNTCITNDTNDMAVGYKAYIEVVDPDDPSKKIVTGYSSVSACNLILDDTTSCKEASGTDWFNRIRQPDVYTIQLFTL